MKITPIQQIFEAVQWNDNLSEMKHFCGNYCVIKYEYAPGIDDYWSLEVDTPNKIVIVPLHHWVVKLDENVFIVLNEKDFNKYFSISNE